MAGCFSVCGFTIPKKKRRLYTKPNIVFVTMDTTRHDRVGFNGYKATTVDGQHITTTPFLDTIAEQGVVFDNSFSQAPNTIPSTASFMTSQYPRGINVEGQLSKIPPHWPTLAEILNDEEGYQTFGAVSVSHVDKKRGFSRGFDYYSIPKKQHDAVKSGQRQYIRNGDETLEVLIRMMSNAEEDKPSFYWFHLFDPHIPYVAPPRFSSRFSSVGEFDDKEEKFFRTLGLRLTEREAVKRSDQYDGQILFADHNISGLIDYLSRNDRFDLNRGDIFIFNADHGELLMEHGYCGYHIGSYEEVTHIPFMMAGGELPKNKRVDALTMNIDIVPTLLDMLGSKNLERFRGKSLLDAVSSRNNKHHNSIFVHYPWYCSVRTDKNKLNKRLRSSEVIADRTGEGYFPSGEIDFSGKDFLLRWPFELEDYNKDALMEIQVFEKRMYLAAKRIFREKYPYNGNNSLNLSANAGQLFANAGWWEKSASGEKMKWRVRILGNSEISRGKPAVLFDSGFIEFRLNPIYPADQLYDLSDEPSETINQYDNPSYGNVRERLEAFVAERIEDDRSQSSEPLVVEISEEEKSALKALGYLR